MRPASTFTGDRRCAPPSVEIVPRSCPEPTRWMMRLRSSSTGGRRLASATTREDWERGVLGEDVASPVGFAREGSNGSDEPFSVTSRALDCPSACNHRRASWLPSRATGRRSHVGVPIEPALQLAEQCGQLGEVCGCCLGDAPAAVALRPAVLRGATLARAPTLNVRQSSAGLAGDAGSRPDVGCRHRDDTPRNLPQPS